MNETPVVFDKDEFILKIAKLIAKVSFLNYHIKVVDGHGGVYLRAEYYEPDIYTQKFEKQYTRKWLLSPLMTDSEVVQTCFKMCFTSMEHKTRESFTYKGSRIFGPHFDVEDLVTLCKKGKEDAGGRKE